MSMGGKSSTPSTTTQTNIATPWAGQQPYLQDLFARAQQQANAGIPAFNGQMVAAPGATTQEAQKTLLQSAGQMQPNIDAAMKQSLWSMGGAMDMSKNPYLQSAIQAAQAPVIQAFNSVGGPLSQIRTGFQANNSGGTGTREGIAMGIAERGLGETLANMSSGMTMQAYGQAQDNAMKSLALAPQTNQMAMMPGQVQSAVGGERDAYIQNLLNAEMQRYQLNSQLPWMNLQNYGNMIGGSYGQSSTGTMTTPGMQGPSALTAGLGGAMSGGALAGMMGGAAAGPWGMGIGALLGILGSR